jgi:MerR family redox-sensitive transcriptional activator SoxR
MLTVGKLSSESGVPASTIRYWERIGVLPKPARTGGQRRYSQDAIHRLAVLRLAQACGFTLEEMRHLLHGFSPDVAASRRWAELAKKKKQEIDEQMERLRTVKQFVGRLGKCKCLDLLECGKLAACVLGLSAK